MEWLCDSKACLDTSSMLISEIEEMINDPLLDDVSIPYMKVKIKNCLENCRSPLDYAAHFIFDEFCRFEYLEREKEKSKRKQNLEPKIYYPIRKSETAFEGEIEKMFFPLKDKKPELLSAFEIGQLFKDPSIPFLDYLNLLTNTNKHLKLTAHEYEHTASINHHAEDIYGNTFSNNVVIGGGGNGIVINGHSLDSPDSINNPYFKFNKSTFLYQYFFTDLNLPVLETLKSIHLGCEKIISTIDRELKET